MLNAAIGEENGRLTLSAPYHGECPRRAKRIGGRWDAARRVWTFDPRDRALVERLAHDLYGWTGPDAPTVDVRVDAGAFCESWDRQVTLAGRCVAWRPERDMDVVLADGVVVVSGAFADRGGTRREPEVGDCDGVVLEVRGLDAGALDLLPEGSYELVDGDERDVLRDVRAALLARLADIDRRLAALDGKGADE